MNRQERRKQKSKSPNVDVVEMSPKYFRPGTKHVSKFINFCLSNGGMGDYVNFMAAFEWLANENPQVHGRILVNPPFTDVAQYIMKPYKRWSVHKKSDFEKIVKTGEAVFDPGTFSKYISAPGAHLLDLGFMYYCNNNTAYEGYNRLPSINYAGPWKWPDLDPESSYAVFTPGATADARATPAKYFNALVDYTIKRGVTPVFLGKADFAYHGAKKGSEIGYYAKFNSGYDFTRGVDLREKTSLLEAVQVMRGARFVIGIDNGLLHFAGTTEVPIVFGHTVTRVEHRKIRRPRGLTIDITIDSKSLPCAGCQSNMRFLIGHRFRNCVYHDFKCLDFIFNNDAEAWRQAIDHVLDKGVIK